MCNLSDLELRQQRLTIFIGCTSGRSSLLILVELSLPEIILGNSVFYFKKCLSIVDFEATTGTSAQSFIFHFYYICIC